MNAFIPELTAVNSSVISAIGYCDTDLYIQFKTDEIYKFCKVPDEVNKKLLEAASVGKFFASEIKNNYDYKRLI